jgi:hypothetical protein
MHISAAGLGLQISQFQNRRQAIRRIIGVEQDADLIGEQAAQPV